MPVLDEDIWYVVSEMDYDDDIDEVDEVNNQAVWNRPIHMRELDLGCTTVPVPGAGIPALVVLGCLRRRRSTA